MYLVSIIVPVYNVEHYIIECINSIIGQTYNNIEIILVDDGSTDRSGYICDYYSELYPNVKVIHKKNGGLSSSRNAGLDKAQGYYISFVDSDDKIDKEYISSLVSSIENSNSDVAVSSIKLFYDDGSIRNFYDTNESIMSGKEYLINILKHRIDNSVCNKLFKKNIISELRFKNKIINEDFPFMCHLLQNVKTLSFTKEINYYYRQRIGSITQQPNKRIFDFIQNALNLEKSLRIKYDYLIEEYVFYEAINLISTIEKYNAHYKFKDELTRAKKIITSKFLRFLKSNLAISQKIKFILVSYFPQVYRFLIKRHDKCVRSNL